MSARFVTSAPIRPRTYVSRPQRVADHIAKHGREIQPLHEERGVGGKLGLAVFIAAAVFLGFVIAMPLLGGHAASRVHLAPNATGSTVPAVEAGGDKR